MMHDYFRADGRYLPVKFGAALSENVGERYTVQDAPGKRWVFANAQRPGGGVLREWDLELPSLEEDDLALVQGFLHGAYGRGPFAFIPAVAQATNVLTPAQSMLLNTADAALADGVDGVSRMVPGSGSRVLAAGAAVLPGGPVTVTADVSGAATLTITFLNASGGVVGAANTSTTGVLMQRVSWSGVAPVAARTVDVSVVGHTLAGRPQVTWTSGPVDWAAGAGASEVVVMSGSVSHSMVKYQRRGAWSSASVKIVEVG